MGRIWHINEKSYGQVDCIFRGFTLSLHLKLRNRLHLGMTLRLCLTVVLSDCTVFAVEEFFLTTAICNEEIFLFGG